MRAILEALPDKPITSSADIQIEMIGAGERPPKVLPFAKSWQDKDRVGTIPVSETVLKLPKDRPSYRHARLAFLREQIMWHQPSSVLPGMTEWLDDATVRHKAFRQFDVETTLYRCTPESSLIRRLESLLGGTLYFRRSEEEKAELVLLNSNRLAVPFPQWSDGQKAVFYLLLMLDYEKPDILLLDEIENHLHPLYMTAVMDFIKKQVPQSFIATHHPHVIFTELADRVFYLETVTGRLADAPPKELRYTKIQQQGAPTRTVTTLSDSFGKVTATYKLFDLQDRQLLKQFARITTDAEITFYQALLEIFSPEIVPASKRPLPDRQTALLANIIKGFAGEIPATERVRILDVGAGIGRTAQELGKLTQWQLGSGVDWICWEPAPHLRAQMRDQLKANRIDADVPESFDEVAPGFFHLVLIANVLHERPPDEFASLIVAAHKGLGNDARSGLVVMEVFPLLRAEKYAVPYSSNHLVRLLNAVGFYSTTRSFPVHDMQGYCILARPNGNLPTEAKVMEELQYVWDDIEKEICSSYACQRTITSYEDYRCLIQELTTLASMTAWRHRIWKGSVQS